MNKDIMKSARFAKEVQDVENKKCPFCKKPINVEEFRDRISLKEYTISGLCQVCQDKTFGK